MIIEKSKQTMESILDMFTEEQQESIRNMGLLKELHQLAFSAYEEGYKVAKKEFQDDYNEFLEREIGV